MDDDGDSFVLNTVISAPKSVERRTNHSEANRRKEAANAATAATAATRGRGAAGRGRAHRGGGRGGLVGARGAPSARQPAQKRKTAPVTAATDDEHGDDASAEFGVVPIEVDGDDEPREAAATDAAEAREAEWKSIKQPRWDGSKSASSSSAAAAAAASSVAAGSSVAAAVAPASSSSAPSATGPKKFTRPAAKPLPHIVRHSTAQLDASALRPITPQSSQHQESVFGKLDSEEPTTVVVKKEGDDAHLKDDPSLPPLPTTGFGALGLSPRLLRALVEKLELKYPTRIQKEGIPLLLGKSGNRPDALIKSETGSGKTLTYLIPIVERLSTEAQRPDRSQGTRAIILSPTRELVLQILGVCQNLLDKAGFYFLIAGMIMGGEKKKSEKSRLRKGLHILVCTPGRLLDHLENTEALVLDRLSYFVLDEADRLMDMGFERDLSKIVSLLDEKSKAGAKASLPAPAIVDPRTGLAIQSAKSKLASERALALALSQCKRQNILVSATLNKEIEKMASITLTNPTLIGFKTAPEESKLKNEDGTAMDLVNANEMVHDTSLPVGLVQQYLQVEHRHKLVALAALLRKKVVEAEMSGKHFKAVVFFSTCASVEFHHSLMSFSFWPYDASMMGSKDKSALLDTQLLKLHGNLTQQERTRTYNQFCKDAEGILLCTDVAARGLDLPAVDYILQYDAPEDTADYIHRVGRTARMGRKGQAILFLTSEELDYLTILKDKSILPEPLSFAHILQSLHSDAAKNRIYDDARGGSPAGAILQKQFENLVAAQPALKESAINAYHSFLRAYAAYPKQLKSIFHPRKLHIGHVARSFALQDAPSLLAKSEIVSKQKQADAREKEREEENAGASSSSRSKKKFVPPTVAKKLHKAAEAAGAAAHAARAPASDSQTAILESITAGVQPAFGQRDRARNVAAVASDASFQQRQLARSKKDAKEVSNIGWRIGSEAAGNKPSKLAKTGIDRVRSNKVAAAFKKKKVDLASEFAA